MLNRESDYRHRVQYIQIKLATKFQLKQVIFIFWTKFPQNRYPLLNGKSKHHHQTHRLFELIYLPNYNLNRQFWFFEPNLLKKGRRMPKCEILC